MEIPFETGKKNLMIHLLLIHSLSLLQEKTWHIIFKIILYHELMYQNIYEINVLCLTGILKALFCLKALRKKSKKKKIIISKFCEQKNPRNYF